MNIMGSYSGIGMDTVDQLMEAEKSKGVRFTNKKLTIEKQQNAWKDASSRLNNFFKQIENLQNRDTFHSQTVKSNIKESPHMSITADDTASSGNYEIAVKKLATASRLTGNRIETVNSISDDLKLTGDFAFENAEGEKFVIQIKDGDSLKDITENINNLTKDSKDGDKVIKGSGIKANIIDNRLVLTDTELGNREIKVNIDGANNLWKDLGFVDDSISGSTVPIKAEAGKQATIEVDGLAITRNSNQITDAIEGLTIDLTSIHSTGGSERITVNQDSQKTVDAVKELVDQYNSIMSFIDDKTDYGDPSAENNKTGELAGESSILRLQSGLRSIFSNDLKNVESGEIKSLSTLGIEVDRYGKATVNERVLTEKVQEDPANVARFFYQPEVKELTNEAGEVTRPGKPKGGMSELLKNFVDSYTSSSKGIIKTRQDSYDRMLKDIEKQIETFDMRMDRKRTRYIREFTALDQAMMQAESQMDFMFSQLGMGQE